MHSYVTLVTNNDFAIGAMALAKSLIRTKARYPLSVMVKPEMLLSDKIQELKALGCLIYPVENFIFSEGFKERHERKNLHKNAPFNKGKKPIFHSPLDNFLKLHLWELEQYQKVVFLDADCLVYQNIDNLFDFPEFSGSPNLYESLNDMHRLNSGVFVAKPNQNTLKHMLEELDTPNAFWRRTDQTFLEYYFPNWHNLPYTYNCLQYVWFNLPELWRWESIKVIHFQYEKPWEKDHPKAQELKPLIDLWWEVYNG
ncbi:MAG: glycosyltransferase [Alphaproteobacteria bacterium]